MDEPDFEGAKTYALERLERELSPQLCYHTLAHTQDEVVPAVEWIAAGEQVSDEDLLLLRTAAYFHDIGYIQVAEGHENMGIQIAEEVLPGLGYSPAQIDVIRGIILATRLPQTPQNRLEEVMADGDLDGLGLDSFLERSRDLRTEQESFGRRVTDEQWYLEQINFLRSHHYWTATAQAGRDAGKLENIARLTHLLAAERGRAD